MLNDIEHRGAVLAISQAWWRDSVAAVFFFSFLWEHSPDFQWGKSYWEIDYIQRLNKHFISNLDFEMIMVMILHFDALNPCMVCRRLEAL